MTGFAPRAARRWRGFNRALLCLGALVSACSGVESLFPDTRPPEGQVAYSANPAPAGSLVITASFDEPLAAAPAIQVSRPGQSPTAPQPMLGAGTEWRHLYEVSPEGSMALLSQPLEVTVSGIVDETGNPAGDLQDASAYVHAPNPQEVAASLETLEFVKHPEAVLVPGPPGAWDDADVDVGDVLKVGDTYVMYYTGTNNASHSTGIGLATSADGIAWTKHPDPVIVPGEGGDWNAGPVLQPSVWWDGAMYHLWYVSHPPEGDMYSFRFAHTTSQDGIHWEPAQPVLASGPSGAWDEERIDSLDVTKAGDLFVLYYAATTLTPEFERSLGCATSRDGVAWEKCQQNPLLRPDPEEAPFEGNEVEGPSVIDLYGSWLMAYTGYGGPQGALFDIGLARSADGRSWVRFSSEPMLPWGAPGTFDENGTSQPVLLIEGNHLWMWYTGFNSHGTAIGLAAALLE